MIIMSLRGAFSATKQSPVSRGDIVPLGDCFATCARNDMQGGALPAPCSSGRLQSAGGAKAGKRDSHILPGNFHRADSSYTHQENHAARSLYERRGFTAVQFGMSPLPESAPDVEYHWRP